MSVGVQRILLATACLLWLTGCETTSTPIPDIFGRTASTSAPAADPETTGSIAAPVPENGDPAKQGVPPLMGTDPYDDLNLGKQYFRQGAYGQAEQRFRRSVEKSPRDAEAWLGLAASYDRLKRFDLADRAYEQLIRLVGPTPEILNNQGFSYMLRGDYRKARQILLAARAKDPGNPYIKNNIDLLDKSARTHKAVE
jgi:tetratricopeptide (TPR) repeat protein